MNVTSSSAIFKTAQCWLFIVTYRYIVIYITCKVLKFYLNDSSYFEISVFFF